VAKYHGKNTAVYINDGSWRDLSADGTSVELNGQADTVDVSGFGAVTKSYTVGLQDGQVRVQFNFNDTATTGVHDVISDKVGSTVGVRIMPAGSVAARPMYHGSMIVSEYSVSSGISAAVTCNVNLVPDSGSVPVWAATP
jgi:hypothetical protein